MRMTKVNSVEDYKLYSNFQTVRQTLKQPEYNDRLEKPLAYWALPNDRRLPLAFLGRTVKDLLETPFEELSATPGVGQKKISSLVKLLHRATQDSPPSSPFGRDDEPAAEGVVEQTPQVDLPPVVDANGDFNPDMVSEVLWDSWRETVRKHNLGGEKLGRLAPALSALPTVIWHADLNSYLDKTVSDIRSLKTHGEKRVRVVLEVFYLIHNLLSDVENDSSVAIKLLPKFIPTMETWIEDTRLQETAPTHDQLLENVVAPLLSQIKVDGGETVYNLVKTRLGYQTEQRSVRNMADEMNVTRARVYQLLDECGRVMEVRWPNGRCVFNRLVEALEQKGADPAAMSMISTTRDLFFPSKFEPVEVHED